MNIIKLFLFVIIATYSFGETISLDKDIEVQEILSKSQIYIDHTQKLTIDDIYNGKVSFKDNDKSVLGFGYSPDFSVWVKVVLKNDTDKKIEKIIEYDNALTTDIEFFISDEKRLKDGSFNIPEDRKTLTPFFKLELEAGERKIFYIKSSSQITTLIVKLNLWNSDNFYEKEIKHQLILALFFGAMTVLALYNLSIYFFTKDMSYMFYFFYILGIIMHQLVYVGSGSVYIFTKDILIAIITHASLLVTFPSVALGLFTKFFLQIRQYSVLNKLLNLFLVITIISPFLFIFSEEYNKYRSLIPFLLLIYLMFITTYASIKKNRQAYFILFGWLIFLTSGMFMFLSSAGILSISDDFKYYVEIGLVLEAIIFSIALADRIKQLQKEKNKINEKLILQEKEEGQKLKVQVEEKTRDLKDALDEKGILLKELHHRVKNNMQMIMSLLELQSDDIEDEKTQGIFKTVQNRIYAMSEIHELLYREDVNISKINTYEYFDRIIDELRQSYDSEDINIHLEIDTKIDIAQAIYCGLILNELVTNSMKYGFEAKKGNIIVTLKSDEGRYLFHIEDDGIGYDRDDQSESLGLLLVDTLVTKQLKGTLNTETNNGVKVDISWRLDDKN